MHYRSSHTIFSLSKIDTNLLKNSSLSFEYITIVNNKQIDATNTLQHCNNPITNDNVIFYEINFLKRPALNFLHYLCVKLADKLKNT